MNKNYHNFMFGVVALCAVVLSSSIILCKNIEKTKFHGDESGHITSAFYYTGLLLKFDFDSQKWKGEHLQFFGSKMYLHLGQWFMGIPLKWYSMRNGQEYSKLYNFTATLEENKRAGRVPPQNILLFARGTSAFWGVLCCVLMLGISYCSRNLWVGLIAAVLLMTNKLFIQCATRAMTDINYIFFLLCVCLLVIILAKLSKKKSLLSLSVLCGVLSGLAASVKLMGIAVIGLFLLVYLIYQDFIKNKRLKNILLCMVIFSFSAIVIVYALNPYLWDLSDPWKLSLLFKTWGDQNNKHARYYMSWWENNRLWVFHRDFLSKHANFSFEWIFLCGGIISFSINFAYSLYKKKFNLWVVPFLFFGVNYLFILTFMAVNWDRYYLPTIVASKFVIAGAMYDFGFFLYRYIFNNRQINAWYKNYNRL